MRAVITRVTSAEVRIKGETYSQIGRGLLVLLGVQQGDTEKDIQYICEKTCGLRIFEDQEEKMNLSIQDVGGEILLVSQFTLLGDARKGKRPSFIRAGAPILAKEIYDKAVQAFLQTNIPVYTGVFQAYMQIESVNDGPVTILLDSRKLF